MDVGSIGDAHANNTAGAQELLLLDRVNGIPEAGDRRRGQTPARRHPGGGRGRLPSGCCSTYQNGVALPQPPLSCWWGGRDRPAPLRLLPDSAIPCSCHNVSKGDVVAAVRAGNHEPSAVKSCTRSAPAAAVAATCRAGGDQTLADLGVEADGLCEHRLRPPGFLSPGPWAS